MSNRYYMPDTLESWKWPRPLDPHYIEVKAASKAWLRSFEAFGPRAQHALIVATWVQAEVSCVVQLLYSPLVRPPRQPCVSFL